MSIPEIELTTEPDGAAPQTSGRARRRGDTWGVTRSGLDIVIELELRQRVRSTRWVLLLVIWTAVIGGLTALIWYAFRQAAEADWATPVEQARMQAEAGRSIFATTVLLVLALGSLVAPALSATSINGDRTNGVLATLQTTLLTPAEIVLGKLLASWMTSLALLITSAPFIVWAYSTGGTPFARLAVTLAILALMLLVVCAIGLGWSAITARTTSSAVLTYLSVATLGLGLPLLFLLTLPVNTETDHVKVLTIQPSEIEPDPSEGEVFSEVCRWETQEMTRTHTERTWWLLAASPAVVVADAAPRPPVDAESYDDDPLSLIRQSVREARLGPAGYEVWCDPGQLDDEGRRLAQDRRDDERALSPVWPVGLLLDLGLGLGFTLVAVRRLRTPSRKLPRGVRVA